MIRQVEFLKQLHEELVDEFGTDLGTALLGTAAAEFFAGPEGVTAMYEKQRTSTGKPIPAKRYPK